MKRSSSLGFLKLVAIPCLFLLLVLVAGCGGTAPPPQTPPIQFTTVDLGLPPAALSAPVVGPLPAATLMHVSITLKANQQLLVLQLELGFCSSQSPFVMIRLSNGLMVTPKERPGKGLGVCDRLLPDQGPDQA